MRIRTIKPEFWSHPVMSAQSDVAKLLAIGLLNLADDEGYFFADARMVRNALRPLDDDSMQTQCGLNDLARIGFIQMAEHPTHGMLGRVVSFPKHQNIGRKNQSRLKPLWQDVTPLNAGSMQAQCEINSGTGNREQGMEQGREGKEIDKSISAPTKAVAFWSEQTGYEIPDEVLTRFREAYPACDILSQARRASEWLIANPRKRKKDHHRFLTNWLSRAQEGGGDIAANRPRYGRGNEPVGSSGAVPTIFEVEIAKGLPDAPEGWWDILRSDLHPDTDIPRDWGALLPHWREYAIDLAKERAEGIVRPQAGTEGQPRIFANLHLGNQQEVAQ